MPGSIDIMGRIFRNLGFEVVKTDDIRYAVRRKIGRDGKYTTVAEINAYSDSIEVGIYGFQFIGSLIGNDTKAACAPFVDKIYNAGEPLVWIGNEERSIRTPRMKAFREKMDERWNGRGKATWEEVERGFQELISETKKDKEEHPELYG